MIKLAFSLALFLSAFLLFSVQPMVAKMLLPTFGGTPAVWTICMLFFQMLLLLAYGYAWLLSKFKNSWFWRLFHLGLIIVSFFALPLKTIVLFFQDKPEFSILLTLVKEFSLPLFILGASAPLLQFAYSQTKAKEARDPYFLYVASNCGSLLALFFYPFLLERFWGLNQLFSYWNYIFIGYVFLLSLIFISLPYQARPPLEEQRVSWLRMLRWVTYSFIPCSLMLGVTFYISTDIAATPLFWIIPLALYLLSFIITFAKKPLISPQFVNSTILFVMLFPFLSFIIGSNIIPAWELIIIHLASFFMLALLGHGNLVAERPGAESLTTFYFCLSLGGALAGLFNGLLAPHFFNTALEYPLILLLSLLLIPLSKKLNFNWVPLIMLSLLAIDYYLPNQPFALLIKKYHVLPILGLSLSFIWPQSRINFFVSILILFVFLFSPWFKKANTLTEERNFYGIKQVLAISEAHILMSQSTVHGFQLTKEPRLLGTVAYYGPTLAVINTLRNFNNSLNSLIIGLGTGMMACQFQKGENLTFVDIDKQVINIASNPDYFTYLKECPPTIHMKEGDGRLILKDQKQQTFDLLVLDAFSSDAIPTHLLTLEAFSAYQKVIKEKGAILVNISNRHLQLLPVLTAAGRRLELIVIKKIDNGNQNLGQFASEWVLLTANMTLANQLMSNNGWQFVTEDGYLWTDDYSNLLPLIK